MFDTSNFEKNHPSGIPLMNKKVIGLMKDETGGKQIQEFICLKPKMYAFTVDGKEEKKCKGIPKATIKNDLRMKNFKECLVTQKKFQTKSNIIRSYRHTMYTQEITKVALSPHDDKRIILEDGIETLPIGHWRNVRNIILPDTINLPKTGSLCRKCLSVLTR